MNDQNAQWQEMVDYWTRRALLHLSNAQRLPTEAQRLVEIGEVKAAVKSLRRASERLNFDVDYVDREFTGEAPHA